MKDAARLPPSDDNEQTRSRNQHIYDTASKMPAKETGGGRNTGCTKDDSQMQFRRIELSSCLPLKFSLRYRLELILPVRAR